MLNALWLTSFVTVAETLSFTAAAARLGLRQSTVSEHIRKLEAACGRRLLIRDTHAVAVTVDGEAMLGFARTILETNARALSHFSGEMLRGRLRLGVSEDVVLRGFPQVLRRLTIEHPDVQLELTVGLSEDLRERLNLGDLDLVFLKRRIGATHGDFVWREPLVWLAAPDFRPDPARPLPLVLLAPPALTRSAALEAVEAHQRPWRVACTSGSQSGVHAAALAGLGVAPHARSLAPPGLVEVAGLPPLGDIEFALIAGRGTRRGPAQALAAAINKSGYLLRAAGSGPP